MEENRLRTHTKCPSIGLEGNNRVKDKEEGRGEREEGFIMSRSSDLSESEKAR